MQREGTDVTLVGYGKMVGYNLKAAEQLEKEGISCEVCHHTESTIMALQTFCQAIAHCSMGDARNMHHIVRDKWSWRAPFG